MSPQMSLPELQAACEAGLADLPIPHPFSVEQLRRNMEEKRGRAIIFQPIPEEIATLDTACGLRIGTDEFDILLYRERPSAYLTEHVQLHELAHVWFNHGTELNAEQLASLVPVFDSTLVDRVLTGDNASVQARRYHDTDQEKIAELAASFIPRMAREVESDDMLGRLGDTLSRPAGGRRARHRFNPFRRS